MRIEKVVQESFKLSLFGVADPTDERLVMASLMESLLRLSAQSQYAPSAAHTAAFVENVRSGSRSSAESFWLVTLTDWHSEVRGFLQIRFFSDCADLDFIIVDPELRGNGFAREMMEFVLSELRANNVVRILLEVGVENNPAVWFYRRLGFREIYRRKGYYRSGEDALVMELYL